MGEAASQCAENVGVTIGLLPTAPLAMPKQVLERRLGLMARLAGLWRLAQRPRGLGH